MAKAIAIINMTDEQLATELAEVNRKIDAGVIRWTNAQNEQRSATFGSFNHTGKIVAVKDTEAWRSAIACQLKVESERRNGGDMASVKAGHQKKADTASVTVRTVGLKASESTVTCQLAEAQKLADRARLIGATITARKERQAQADAIAAEVQAAKERQELTAEAASYAVAEAVEEGIIPVGEVEELNAELAVA